MFYKQTSLEPTLGKYSHNYGHVLPQLWGCTSATMGTYFRNYGDVLPQLWGRT